MNGNIIPEIIYYLVYLSSINPEDIIIKESINKIKLN